MYTSVTMKGQIHSHAWDQVKVWILKGEKSHSKCISKYFFYCFWDIWILKYGCSLKSPTHALHRFLIPKVLTIWTLRRSEITSFLLETLIVSQTEEHRIHVQGSRTFHMLWLQCWGHLEEPNCGCIMLPGMSTRSFYQVQGKREQISNT